MNTRTTITEDQLESREVGGEGLHVLVIAPEIFSTAPLPERGALLVGRATDAELHVDDPLASRQHARLHLGDGIAVEDLGSANGTRVGERRLAPQARVAVAMGEPIGIGSTVLIVGRGRWYPGPRRRYSHVSFENRLRDECARAELTDGRFALVRVHVEGGAPWTRVFPVLARNLQPPNVFASYAASEYEALLGGAHAETLEVLLGMVGAELRQADVNARIAAAWYPRDGRTADELLSRANAKVWPRPTAPRATVPGLHAPSPAMQKVYDMAARAAASNINVLVLGETGVGKEVMAQHIHRSSPRAARPIVSLNCAGLSENLIEAELFGHERGAFTGAVQARPGLLETAQGGTVFLDEIGEMPLRVQAALLRAIESREVLPVGGRKPRPIDVRFIAATNRDLEAESERGRFRQDLYFRLNAITLAIPPLRERRSEIAELARTFLAQACEGSPRAAPTLSSEALDLIERYGWPGNVRELKNVIERASVLCDGHEILVDHLPVEKMRPSTDETRPLDLPPSVAAAAANRLGETQLAERQRILDALSACAGNQSRAAKMLGMPRRTFVSKLDLYAIPRPQKSPRA